MPALVVPSGALFTLRWNHSAGNMYNVLGLNLQPGATVDQNTATALATCAQGAFGTSLIAGHIDSSLALVQAGVRDLRTANLAEFIAPITGCLGTDAGERVAASISCVVTLRTSKAGKRFRGRVFLPLNGTSAYDAETGLYGATATAAAVKFIGDLRTAITGNAQLGGQFALAVLSRSTENGNTPVSTPVISQLVRSQLAGSQRRRLPKRP